MILMLAWLAWAVFMVVLCIYLLAWALIEWQRLSRKPDAPWWEQ